MNLEFKGNVFLIFGDFLFVFGFGWFFFCFVFSINSLTVECTTFKVILLLKNSDTFLLLFSTGFIKAL